MKRVQVFGPAYLDRTILVDGPLVERGMPPLDQSVDGSIAFGPGLRFVDPSGSTVTVEPPADWPGPSGLVSLDRALGGAPRTLRGLSWRDDLGGMGAGFASALDGDLVSALGPEDDPMSLVVCELLGRRGVRHRPVRVSEPADWTLLVSSGPFGDKLPVGFRSCHAAVGSLENEVKSSGGCEVRVVAGLPNRLAAQVLRDPGAKVRVFAPSTRNMTDRETPLARFAEWFDVLCCNRREWESLADREQVAWRVPILVVTDGPNGCAIRFTTPEGDPGRVELPVFPRATPPKDTNRAGEAFATTFLTSLIGAGWSNGVVEQALIVRAAERGSAAAALVLDRTGFGFASDAEIDAALAAGRVGGAGGVPGYNASVEEGNESVAEWRSP